VHILELTYGAVLVSIVAEFGFDNTTAGFLANIFGFAFGLSALPVGIVADRMDARKLLIFCCFGTSLAAVLLGIAPNIILLGAAMLFLGLSLGIYHPTGTTYISRYVRQRSLAFGYQGIGGNLGIAFGPVLAGLIAVSLGWRWSYFIFAVPPLVIGTLIYLSQRNAVNAPPEVDKAKTEPGKPVAKASLKPFALALFLLYSAQVMGSLIYRGVVTFMPKYLGEQLTPMFAGFSQQQIAAYATTFVLIFGVAGQYLGGYLCEKIRHETLGLIVNIAAIPFMLTTAFFTGAPLIISAAVFAFFHFAGQPIFNTLIADYSPASRRGLIFGLYFFFNFGLGSFSATGMGYIADRVGLSQVFTAAAVCGVIGSVFIGALWLIVLLKSNHHPEESASIEAQKR
jgi:MFS family permease